MHRLILSFVAMSLLTGASACSAADTQAKDDDADAPAAAAAPARVPVTAAELQATPAKSTFKALLGDIGPMELRGLAEGVTLDLGKSHVRGLRIYGAKGLTVIGGRLDPAPGGVGLQIIDSDGVVLKGLQGVDGGLDILRSRNVTAERLEIHGARGVYAEDSSNVTVKGGKFIGGASGGVAFRNVSQMTLEDSLFVGIGWDPGSPLAAPKTLTDAIQGRGANRGVSIRQVRIACRCQGVSLADGASSGIVLEDVVMLLQDSRQALSIRSAGGAPRLKDVRVSGAAGAAAPVLDLGGGWSDGGGNTVNGQPLRP